MEPVPGIEWPRLKSWMAANVPDAGEPEGVELIAGGKSNLTYRLDTPARTLVLRRPPLGHVLPTAHDMGREWRVVSALADTGVPVPEAVAFCGDEDVIGAPFYLMGFVDGTAIATPEQAAALTSGEARALSENLADVLAAIHTVDLERTGLSDFGRPAGYMERQLRRWGRQWESSQTRELPAYDRLVVRLSERLPEHSAAALVHGDYRLDNALVRGTEIVAVVDWEMSTLGDPLADLGLTLTYWQDAGDAERERVPVATGVTNLPGFLTSREFAERYARAGGFEPVGLGYYIAFAHFKLAVVLEGIHKRFSQGKTVGEGFDQVGKAVPILIERAHRILDEGRHM